MDKASILGLVIGVGGILLGNALEGGHLSSLIQGTAALIVLGGTAGAVMVSAQMKDLKTGLQLMKMAFGDSNKNDLNMIFNEMSQAARISRKETILALEKRIPSFSHPYMRTVFRHVIDGVEPATLREIFEEEMALEEERLLAGAKIWTDAGGFAPTIGIIGAVLGLIHVMGNLTDTSKLGAGIAVAFVATIYGVGAANLLFIPMGSKIKSKVKELTLQKVMILEGALAILSGLNPIIVEQKLASYTGEPVDYEAADG